MRTPTVILSGIFFSRKSIDLLRITSKVPWSFLQKFIHELPHKTFQAFLPKLLNGLLSGNLPRIPSESSPGFFFRDFLQKFLQSSIQKFLYLKIYINFSQHSQTFQDMGFFRNPFGDFSRKKFHRFLQKFLRRSGCLRKSKVGTLFLQSFLPKSFLRFFQ